MKKNIEKNRFQLYPFILLLIPIIFFIAIRVRPLLFQNLSYTYDQGRDFLKVAEMISNKKPVFIGPTTGINGLFHGAWWYYILTIPYLLFGGLPIGFYWFNFILQLSCLVLFLFFTKTYFGILNALIFGFLIAVSPYFTFTSLFVGNNIMVLPAMLGFLITIFFISENKKIKQPFILSLLSGISLGLISEFELSFGLFLIPSFILGIVLFPHLRKFYFHIKNAFYFIGGLFIIFLPRLLFEMKNGFLQTKTLISFLFKPTIDDTSSYINMVKERFGMFKYFYESLFANNFFTILFTLLAICSIIFYLLNKKRSFLSFLSFAVYIIFMLFLFSTFYKGFFWANYFEGIQYLFIFILLIVFSTKVHLPLVTNIDKYIRFAILSTLLVFTLIHISTTIKKTPKKEGLAVISEVVNYINSRERNLDNYCVRIYTPPTIPYTYNYLFLANKDQTGGNLPQSEWVNGTCWFIMETDPFKFRLQEWQKTNRPKKKAIIEVKQISDVTIERYTIE